MLLENVGERRSAARIDAAIDECLSTGTVAGVTTRSGVSTSDAAQTVLEALEWPNVTERLTV